MEDPSLLHNSPAQIEEYSNSLGGDPYTLSCSFTNIHQKNGGGTSGTLLTPPEGNFSGISNGASPTFHISSKTYVKDLDILVREMNSSCLLNDGFFNELVTKLKSEDPNERYEATHMFHRSLNETLGYSSLNKSNYTKYLPVINKDSKQSKLASNFNFKNSFRAYESGLNFANVSDETPIFEMTTQNLIETDLIPHFIKSLSFKTHINLVSESISLLVLIFSDKNLNFEALVNQNFVDNLIDILNMYKLNFSIEIRNNIFGILAKLAFHSMELRDLILDCPNATRTIVLTAMLNKDVLSISACNDIFFSHRLPRFSELNVVLDLFTDCLSITTDSKMVSIICRAYIKVIEDLHYFDYLYNNNIIPTLLDILQGDDPEARFEALSVFSKIAFQGNRSHINHLIKHDLIRILLNLLENPSKVPAQTRSRTCNLLGNIGYETDEEVQQLIDHNVYPVLINIFRFDLDQYTRTEAAYAVCAAASRANCKQVGNIMSCTSTVKDKQYDTHNNCMQLIADMLEHVSASNPHDASNIKLCLAILKGLSNILEKGLEEGLNQGLRENPYSFFFCSVQGHLKLAQMQFFPDLNIVCTTNEILSKYFAMNT